MATRRMYHFWFVILLPYLGGSVAHAQGSNTLKQCFTRQVKAMQAVTSKRSPGQTPVLLFDSTHQKYQQINQDWAECVKGQPIPLSSFKTLDGESYDSSALAGKVLVINFWFMSCAPCLAEMPALQKLIKEYKGKNVLFLGFSADKAVDLKPAFFQQHPFDARIIPDAREIAKLFYFLGYPTTYIVDQRGTIHKAWVGGNGLSNLDVYYKAKSAIDELLTTTNK